MPKGFKSGGRLKGTPNKSANSIRALAQPFGEEALMILVNKMREGDAHAADKVLDRAYGKPAQAIVGGDENDPPVRVLHEADTDIIQRYLNNQKGKQ